MDPKRVIEHPDGTREYFVSSAELEAASMLEGEDADLTQEQFDGLVAALEAADAEAADQ